MPRTKLYVPAGSDAGGSWNAQWVALGESPAYYSYESEVLADNPLRYWRLNEVSGTTASDEMGAGDLTYQNTPALNQSEVPAGMTDDVSVLFDNSQSEYMSGTLPTDIVTANGGLTIEMWFYWNGYGGLAANILYNHGSGHGTNSNSIELIINPSNDLRFRAFGSEAQASALAISTAQWYHVVCTLDDAANVGHLWLNNTQYGGQTISPTTLAANALNVCRKVNDNLYYFNGYTNEIAVYAGVLSDARIQAHYEVGAGV